MGAVELKVLTAAIYTNFTTSVVDDTGMEQMDAYIAGPVGNKLILQFHETIEDGPVRGP